MPYEKVSVGGGRYNVRNSETGKVHARDTTSAKAEAQLRLLRGVEHGMTPRGKGKVRKAAKGVVVDPYYDGAGPKQATGPAPPGPPPEIRTTRQVVTGRKP